MEGALSPDVWSGSVRLRGAPVSQGAEAQRRWKGGEEEIGTRTKGSD